MIKLQEISYGNEEILEVMDSLLHGNVTMGKKNTLFESMWSLWNNSLYCSSCNSGSSANLLIFSALKSYLYDRKLTDGDEVIIPAVGWSTSYAPIIQNRLKCKLVDINLDLTIDVEEVENAITDSTKAIVVIHLVGFPSAVDKIRDMCNEKDIFLIEDCCESHGAKINGQKVGTFGLASSFSYFFSHHMTTVEGGMVCTSDWDFNNIIKMQRAHGWLRNNEESFRNQMMKDNDFIDDKFLFLDIGYNLRLTELQACFGIHQIEKLDGFIETRRNNHFYLNKLIIEAGLEEYFYLVGESNNQFISPLAYPFICRDENIKEKLKSAFDTYGIEMRPIASGDITKQPFYKQYSDYFICNSLLGSTKHIDSCGFWIGNNQEVSLSDYEKVVDIIQKTL